MNRRNTLRLLALSGPALATIIKNASTPISPIFINNGDTILFQGDSITDAGRNKGAYYANNLYGMGTGYVHHVATQILGKYPEKNIKIYNRGISGHKVHQLDARWEEDCMQLDPNILSLMIGVNDYWHTLTHNYKGTVKIYEDNLTALLERTIKPNPNLKLIIAEPFYIQGGTAINNDIWAENFPAYQYACKMVAQKFGACFIPLQSIFEKALQVAPVSYWAGDGVHPGMPGVYLMAEAWKECLGIT